MADRILCNLLQARTTRLPAPTGGGASPGNRKEYVHAANAVMTFVALCSLTLAALTSRQCMPAQEFNQRLARGRS